MKKKMTVLVEVSEVKSTNTVVTDNFFRIYFSFDRVMHEYCIYNLPFCTPLPPTFTPTPLNFMPSSSVIMLLDTYECIVTTC